MKEKKEVTIMRRTANVRHFCHNFMALVFLSLLWATSHMIDANAAVAVASVASVVVVVAAAAAAVRDLSVKDSVAPSNGRRNCAIFKKCDRNSQKNFPSNMGENPSSPAAL